MNRREAGLAVLFGAAGVAALPGVALAQGAMGEAERMHAMETLKVGSLALMTSQTAQTKARGFRVKEFADFEVAEQTTIAQIIREMTGMAPPPPDAKAQATMALLRAASGVAFDAAYVKAQTDGHNQLLAIQERYIASGNNPHAKHIAMLARGQIKEHLKLLADIRAGRA